MYSESDDQSSQTAIPKFHPSRLFPVPRLTTLIAIGIVVLLIYAFASGLTKQFYASFVFLFYSITGQMWISVVMLGIFQTLLLIPFRVINLLKSANIQEFRETVNTMAAEQEQSYFLKKSVKRGQRVALYYFVNFFVQTTSYISIGRLFLTDFYNQRLDPHLLYSFVPYPDYPIEGRMFKIPYVWFSETTDLGMKWVWIAWGVILGMQGLFLLMRSFMKKRKAQPLFGTALSPQLATVKSLLGYATGSAILMMVLAWFLVRAFPVGWELRLFSGDVAEVNVRFNMITSIIAFFLIIWVSLPKMAKKTDLARAAGIEEAIIRRTEKVMLSDTLKAATLVGAGTFFITNQIPSAFELSIFTLETISLFSPLTLDRVILASVKPKEVVTEEKEKEERLDKPGKEDVRDVGGAAQISEGEKREVVELKKEDERVKEKIPEKVPAKHQTKIEGEIKF